MRLLFLVFSFLSLLACQHPGNGTGQQTIVIYGASGKIGGLLVRNALKRGHIVIGVSRNPDKLKVSHKNFSAVKGDVTSEASMRSVARQADAVVISVLGHGANNLPENSTVAKAARTAVEVFSGDENAPYIVAVGGATTMHGSAEKMAENLPFPASPGSEGHSILFGHLVALKTYRESDIPWSVITPPKRILGWSFQGITDAESSRGTYRTSTAEFVVAEDGSNSIYVRDLARAVIDEVENRRFERQRFTVGY